MRNNNAREQGHEDNVRCTMPDPPRDLRAFSASASAAMLSYMYCPRTENVHIYKPGNWLAESSAAGGMIFLALAYRYNYFAKDMQRWLDRRADRGEGRNETADRTARRVKRFRKLSHACIFAGIGSISLMTDEACGHSLSEYLDLDTHYDTPIDIDIDIPEDVGSWILFGFFIASAIIALKTGRSMALEGRRYLNESILRTNQPQNRHDEEVAQEQQDVDAELFVEMIPLGPADEAVVSRE